jgi:hypothetical protein
MTYDASTNTIVLFATRQLPGGPPWQAETWIWDGHAWLQQHPAHSPAARTDAGIAYDRVRNNVVLFGGLATPAGSSGLLSDTWTWDGSDWTEQLPAVSPLPRIAPLIFDATLGEAVLLGGNAGLAGQFSDIWGWNGVTWSRLSATLPAGWGPPLAAAYDDASASIVALGCGVQSPPTYVFDGTSWHQYSSGGLHTCAPVIAYDAARSVVVLFGGNTGQISNATWTWDGTHWTQQAPLHSPPPRFTAASAFDTASSQLIVFGGQEPLGAQNSVDVTTTWSWNGTDWVQVAG